MSKKTKNTSKKKMSLYANLSHKRKTKKDAAARRRAEYLATLPKHPVKRVLYQMHPKRFFGYWFSKRGLIMAGKIFGVATILAVIGIGSLFAYYRKDIESIRPSELAKRVQSTITHYYDRNGNLLWEDKGDGNYKQVVESDEISEHIKNATIAIEDQDFYNHHGISIPGLARATVNNLTKSGGTQGGSTLTQQLIKQVFLADEAQMRGLDGIPRKIKEVILSIEVERMYDKDQLLTLYLNESPYGGRRNGVESGAQTYFGKSANDVNIAEAALLASIPNQPGLYDPYNEAGHDALIKRQHKVLSDMRGQKMITQAEHEEALEYPILENIKPLVDSSEGMKAPWFVLEVRKQLEQELGKATVGRGGLKITTTLDIRAQEMAEAAVATGAEMLPNYGADNIAVSSVDVNTGQIIAMVGSVDWSREGYGQQNATTSPLEPGSSIKPIVGFAPLFEQREGVNYAPGSILRDENIDSLYCAGYQGSCTLQNYTRQTYGDITIRQGLGSSLNRPAVKAMHIAGVERSLQVAQELGDHDYCAGNNTAGLSAAIGGGCTVQQIQHTNAFASLARNGAYKPLAYVMEVRNNNNEVLKKWEDPEAKPVIDPQAAYMVSDILSDPQARMLTFGAQTYSYGFNIPGIWTAGKTGTTENGKGQAKDSWFMSYSPAVSTGVWMGNHDGSPLGSSANDVVRRVMHDAMLNIHTQIYQPEGRWEPNQKPAQPEGIQTLSINGRADIYPSWYSRTAGRTDEKLIFDQVSKKKATDCTPESAKIELTVSKTTDPITKRPTYIAPDGYNASSDDDIHNCGDVKPSATVSVENSSGNNWTITVNPQQGTHPLSNIKITAGGQVIMDGAVSSSQVVRQHQSNSDKLDVTVTITDTAMYSGGGTGSGIKERSNDDSDENS